jgi:integrase
VEPTLEEWCEEWFAVYVALRLAPQTALHYRELWERHGRPWLGAVPLGKVTPERCERWLADLSAAGVGDPTVRKTAAVVQGSLALAVRWGRLERNPLADIRKPAGGRERWARPPAPERVEEARAWLLARGRCADATLVSLLAYAGLRPQEALALRAGDIGERVLLVERAVALGREVPTKTRRKRAVRLLTPLRDDLAALCASRGGLADGAHLFPRADGGPWSQTMYRNWRRRVWRPAAAAAGMPGARPYDLRHAFCSLLLAAGVPPLEVAADAGHSPQTLFSTYAHVLRDVGARSLVDPEAAIYAARRTADGASDRGGRPGAPSIHSGLMRFSRVLPLTPQIGDIRCHCY